MEITVIAVKDPSEALSTLKTERNNIDLILTDYYMPGMNGLQLKRQIDQEFGNLPVIVMSSDTNKEQESLTCGAMCFIPKPIENDDLSKIYQLALTYKRNGKSILYTENIQKDKDVSVPQQIQLLPAQANVLKTKKKKCSSRSDPRSVTSTNGSCHSTDGSGKDRKRNSNGSSGDDVESPPQPTKKKSKIQWSDDLHFKFLQAINHHGLDKAVPKKILEFMNTTPDVPYLTRENVASHLQKYRQFLRKVANQGLSVLPNGGIDSMFSQAHIRAPYCSYYPPSASWYETSLNNRSIFSKPRQALGQSRLLSNTREPVRFNQSPYNYMNRSSTYEPRRIGSSSSLPIISNLNFSYQQPSQNEGRSFFEPALMANKTGQSSQVLEFGQQGVSATNGNNFNNNMISSYGSLVPNQLGTNSYGSLVPNQLGTNSYGSLTPNQPGLSSHGSLITPNQPGMSSYGSLVTPNQPGTSSYGSLLTPNQPGMSSFEILNSSQPRQTNHGLTSNQLGSFGNLTPNPGLSSHGSLAPNQPGLSSYGSLTPNQPGPSQFSYGVQSFLNNENTSYQPQPPANATTQPPPEVPQLENLNLYDENLGSTNELPWDISNFLFDHNKQQQGEAAPTTNSDLPANFSTELNQNFSLEEDGDWTFVNVNQGHSNVETSNTFAAPEMTSSVPNMNPKHAQEQVDPEFIDWALLDQQDLVNEFDFTNSLFDNDMN
ncbi:unnamed protein product [Microthlaspi erraticum]|uniref:Response regulatory domain-containing protein n=1 Tax=Microthlaspi erraticum TaxID=1685480 RepID=A0A6D2IF26_9BRAS|nr:unnamed protein product [Microthlaspi erraticum]